MDGRRASARQHLFCGMFLIPCCAVCMLSRLSSVGCLFNIVLLRMLDSDELQC